MIFIFKTTKDKNLALHINKIVCKLSFDTKYSIFENINDNNLYSEYLEVLNLFKDELFKKFLKKLAKKQSLKMMLQLLSAIVSNTREEVIIKRLENIAKNIP